MGELKKFKNFKLKRLNRNEISVLRNDCQHFGKSYTEFKFLSGKEELKTYIGIITKRIQELEEKAKKQIGVRKQMLEKFKHNQLNLKPEDLKL